MIHPLHTLGCTVRAALHELRCWECRVTWTSWAQRLVGLKRGYTPKLSKQQRALVERAQRAERVLAHHKATLLDALGMDPLRDWDDIANAARGIRRERDAYRKESR